MPIDVIVSGAKDSDAEYADESFLAADAGARMAIENLYGAGATIGNIQECVQGALEDAGAAE